MKKVLWQHIAVDSDIDGIVGLIEHYEPDGFELVAITPWDGKYKVFFKRLVMG